MKYRSIVIAWMVAVSFISLSQAVNAQIPVPKKAYFHLTGTINKTLPITVEMVKSGDSVYCDFQYSDPGDPAVPVICGKMNATNGTFVFHEPFTSDGLIVRGKWSSGQGFSGTWEEPGKDKVPFEWKENYPVGSTQFNVSNTKDKVPLVKKPKSPSAKVEMVLLTPAESVNPVISDTLAKFITEKFTGRSFTSSDPQAILNTVKSSFFKNYINSNEALYQQSPEAGNMNWESLRFMHILHNGDYVLCFYIIQYAFTGGAHGLESTDYYVVNTMTGRQIMLSDLFREGTNTQLTELLTKEVMEKYCRNHETRLTDAGFFTDEVKPAQNFFVTDKGIGFHYNQYDLAPHSFGAIEAFLTFSQVSDLLKPASELPVKLGN